METLKERQVAEQALCVFLRVYTRVCLCTPILQPPHLPLLFGVTHSFT